MPHKLLLGLPFCGRNIAHIRQKTQAAPARHLGGVMFWEIGQDAPGDGSLLKALRQVVAGAGW